MLICRRTTVIMREMLKCRPKKTLGEMAKCKPTARLNWVSQKIDVFKRVTQIQKMTLHKQRIKLPRKQTQKLHCLIQKELVVRLCELMMHIEGTARRYVILIEWRCSAKELLR